MSGPQLATRLVSVRPEMKVLFMSGYTNGALSLHGLEDSVLGFLQKPITPEALARRVREVLGTWRKGASTRPAHAES
jgi:two-component system, cell cycle sensor histidine kinase and response regulator CckA